MCGVHVGGRTGLTAVVVAALFAMSLFFEPLVAAIPAAAYAPALIAVGAMMVESVVKIDFDDYTELIPAFTVIALMSFTYNGVGITAGLVLYPLVKLAAGRRAKSMRDCGCYAGCRFCFTFFILTNSEDASWRA